MATQTGTLLYDTLLNDFAATAANTGALQQWRSNAFEAFRQQGFPTTRQEDWRFTNVTPLLKDEWQTIVPAEFYNKPTTQQVEQYHIPGLDAEVIVLVNGRFQPALSTFNGNAGITIKPVAEAAASEAYHNYLGKEIDLGKNSFAALNSALFTDGILIEVKAGAQAEKPLHLINLFASGGNAFLQPRNLVIAHKNAGVTIIETTAALSQAAYWLNTVTEVYTGENAQVNHYVLQSGPKGTRQVNHTEVTQHRSSLYNNYTITLPGADFIRNNLNVNLTDSNTETHLYGLYMVNGQQLVDNHTRVDHRKPNCFSNELYKGVMSGNSRAVFNGKIYVHQEAQKTNAFQQNNNLLLSDKAVVDSKPQLEIFADDVKCSHGSTAGQFNNEALFYLRSRGIGEASARALMVSAFAFDVINKIKIDAVKAFIEAQIIKNLEEWYV